MRTIAFIDAGQFRPSILINKLQLASNKRFDWDKFKQFLDHISGEQLFDAHYFDSLEADGNTRQQAFHKMLKNGLGFNLHFSDLKEKRTTCHKCNDTQVEYEQKGVDVDITISMMKLAYSGAYDQALLCSGDGDFAPLVEYLRDSLGKRVTIVCWADNISAALKNAAFKTIHIESFKKEVIGDRIPLTTGVPTNVH